MKDTKVGVLFILIGAIGFLAGVLAKKSGLNSSSISYKVIGGSVFFIGLAFVLFS